jgi:signal transduction histidine kinase
MKGPPGDNYLEERTEFLALEERHFPALIRDCPVFTAYTVHTMLDRARNFNTSALQDEKMVSLGKLAAGLAHELNNPASATVRGAKLLRSGLADAAAAARALRASGCGDETLDVIERVWQATLAAPVGPDLDPLQRADREDMIAEWLDRHGLDEVDADSLVDTAVTVEALDTVAEVASDTALEAAVRWIAAECATHALADDIERSAARIYDLVGAVKQFTYMDNLAGPESVAVEPGLRDTIRILTAKVRAKSATVTVDVAPDLPLVYATGGELNQVWMNLIDNALDAIGDGGRVDVTARAELDRVVVRVIDDGPGIPAEMISSVFDPFFTTKPPGQGTGLGLDIAQRLVRRYHGDVMVDSRPGRTVFTVTLRSGHAPEPPVPEDGEVS